MKPGDFRQTERRFTARDVTAYFALGGAPPRDGEVPELLIGALFSYLLGVVLPGRGTNYLKQQSRYLAPARLDERLTARVEVLRLRPEKHLVDFATTCRNESGALLCDGRALVFVGDV